MWIIALITVMVILGGMHFFTHSHKDDSGVIVPLYTHPNDNWDELIHERISHEMVPMIAIINPDNGPGVLDSDFVSGIQKLQRAKITVLGYVSTQYGSRNSSSIISEIDSYKDWYHVDGIFFDEMSYKSGYETYYANLTKYAKSHGLTMTVGNPGVDTIPSYIGTVDNIVIHENSSLPSPDLFSGWHTNYTKSNFSIILYNVTSMNKTYTKFLAEHTGYIYVTNQSDPNPWEVLSPYLDEIMSIINSNTNEFVHRYLD